MWPGGGVYRGFATRRASRRWLGSSRRRLGGAFGGGAGGFDLVQVFLYVGSARPFRRLLQVGPHLCCRIGKITLLQKDFGEQCMPLRKDGAGSLFGLSSSFLRGIQAIQPEISQGLDEVSEFDSGIQGKS